MVKKMTKSQKKSFNQNFFFVQNGLKRRENHFPDIGPKCRGEGVCLSVFGTEPIIALKMHYIQKIN